MTSNLLKSARVVFVEELVKDKTNHIGETVRVTGRLKEFDSVLNRAILEDDAAATCFTLSIDTTDLPQPLPIRIGSICQFIGEITSSSINGTLLIRARVSRSLEGANMDLYRKSLEIRRKFLPSS